MRKRANTSQTITGNTIEDIRRQVNSALGQIWNTINALTETTEHQRLGQGGLEDKESGLKVVEDGASTYLEYKTKKGWARLDAEFLPKTKRS